MHVNSRPGLLYTRTLNTYYVSNYVVASVCVERTYVLLLRCDNVVQNCNCTILANLTQNGSRHVAIRKPPILKCIIIIIHLPCNGLFSGCGPRPLPEVLTRCVLATSQKGFTHSNLFRLHIHIPVYQNGARRQCTN